MTQQEITNNKSVELADVNKLISTTEESTLSRSDSIKCVSTLVTKDTGIRLTGLTNNKLTSVCFVVIQKWSGVTTDLRVLIPPI